MVADLHPFLERQETVQTRHEEQNPGFRFWVDSRQLANSFISFWCRTVIGQNTTFPDDWPTAGVPQLQTLTHICSASSMLRT